MATYVGHSLMGLIFAAIARQLSVPYMAFYIFLSNLPDLGKLYKNGYSITHNVFFAMIGILFVWLFALPWWVALLPLTHLVLDCCYKPGLGLRLFWPISKRYFKFAKVLRHMDIQQPFGPTSLKAYAVEIIIFLPILIILLILMGR